MTGDLINRISLKQSIAICLILGGEKTLDQIIDELPSVDAVPVVRCKDCKHYEMASNEANGWCEKNELPFAPWDYCSYGERKEK